MFAGPNGSGKSTFNSKVPAHLLVNYINPDAIELSIRETGVFEVAAFGLERYARLVLPFLRSHTLLLKFPDSLAKLDSLVVGGEQISFPFRQVDSYIASALSDFIRVSLIEERMSFTFDLTTRRTVSPALLSLLKLQKARISISSLIPSQLGFSNTSLTS